MTSERKIKLMKEVLDVAYLHLDSWRDRGGTGTTMAYLCYAIVDDSFVDWTTEDTPANRTVLAVLRKHFGPRHLVWKFILAI